MQASHAEPGTGAIDLWAAPRTGKGGGQPSLQRCLGKPPSAAAMPSCACLVWTTRPALQRVAGLVRRPKTAGTLRSLKTRRRQRCPEYNPSLPAHKQSFA